MFGGKKPNNDYDTFLLRKFWEQCIPKGRAVVVAQSQCTLQTGSPLTENFSFPPWGNMQVVEAWFPDQRLNPVPF